MVGEAVVLGLVLLLLVSIIAVLARDEWRARRAVGAPTAQKEDEPA